jgi:hypothetical protein
MRSRSAIDLIFFMFFVHQVCRSGAPITKKPTSAATILRSEARLELARNLQIGTGCLTPLAVRRIIQIANRDLITSLDAVCRVDRAVYKLSVIFPAEQATKRMERVVQMYEDEIRDRTPPYYTGPAADRREPTGQKLVEDLAKIPVGTEDVDRLDPATLAEPDTKRTQERPGSATTEIRGASNKSVHNQPVIKVEICLNALKHFLNPLQCRTPLCSKYTVCTLVLTPKTFKSYFVYQTAAQPDEKEPAATTSSCGDLPTTTTTLKSTDLSAVSGTGWFFVLYM